MTFGEHITITWWQLISNEELRRVGWGEQGEKSGGRGGISESKYIKPFNSVDSGLPGSEWELIHGELKLKSSIQNA